MGDLFSLVALDAGQLRDRSERLRDYLDAWGDLVTLDAGGRRSTRLLEFRVEAPGHDLAPDVVCIYREYYRRQRDRSWLLSKYTYEYHDLREDVRLAFHLHDVGGVRLVPHAHCGARGDDDAIEQAGHLRATELDLREAHQLFMRLYAGGQIPDCRSFLPLVPERD